MVGATFLCSTCSASFGTNDLRRDHMREPWHVFNMQRKVAELPAVSLQSYQSLVGAPDLETQFDQSTKPTSERLRDHDAHSRIRSSYEPYSVDDADDDESDDDVFLSQPEKCLFCSSIAEEPDQCLIHMQQSHGFHIPRIEDLQTDLETFLAYLNLVITRFHSCLYCGQEKHSAEAARSHMLSKGHCMLDLSDGSDFLDFWQSQDHDDGTKDDSHAPKFQKLPEGEIRFQSGSVASSRHDGRPMTHPARAKRKVHDSAALVTTATNDAPENNTSEPHPTPSTARSKTTALSKRDQMGIVGLSDSQQRSLAITHQKLIAREQRFKNDARWTVEKFGNKTKMKHFKVSRSGIHSAIQVC